MRYPPYLESSTSEEFGFLKIAYTQLGMEADREKHISNKAMLLVAQWTVSSGIYATSLAVRLSAYCKARLHASRPASRMFMAYDGKRLEV